MAGDEVLARHGMIAVRRFLLAEGAGFELPEDWLSEAEILRFEPRAAAYRAADIAGTMAVSLRDVAPLDMSGRQHLDYGGFDRARMVSVLRAIAQDCPLPPVAIVETRGAHAYRLHDGAHRFYASAAAGFSMVPAVVVVPWSPEGPGL